VAKLLNSKYEKYYHYLSTHTHLKNALSRKKYHPQDPTWAPRRQLAQNHLIDVMMMM